MWVEEVSSTVAGVAVLPPLLTGEELSVDSAASYHLGSGAVTRTTYRRPSSDPESRTLDSASTTTSSSTVVAEASSKVAVSVRSSPLSQGWK